MKKGITKRFRNLASFGKRIELGLMPSKSEYFNSFFNRISSPLPCFNSVEGESERVKIGAYVTLAVRPSETHAKPTTYSDHWRP